MTAQSGRFHLVLLPGLDGTGRLFDRFIAQSPDGVSTEVKTYPSDRFLDYSGLANRLQAELPARPFWLLAESFSGPLAARLCAAGPPHLLGIVFAVSFVRCPRPFWLRALPWSWLFRLPAPGFALRWAFAGGSAAFLPELRQVRAAVAPGVLSARLRLLTSADESAALGRTSVPVLYLQGRRDRLVLASAARQVQRVRSDAEVVTLDAPHLLLQSEPRRAWSAIAEFIERKTRCGGTSRLGERR